MAWQRASGVSISRRAILAAAPSGALFAAGASAARAQPTAADPVSFYLGQVLALATLQAEAIGRLRPFLAVPAAEDVDWQATTAEAGVIGAVAAVLGAMAPPPELSASVGELRLASAAYQGAAGAARSAAAGDAAALGAAAEGLAEGGGRILLWLDALTAETGNDWGDGLRSLTLGTGVAPVADLEVAPAVVESGAQEAVDPGDGAPAEGGAQARGQGQARQVRRNRQSALRRERGFARQ